MNERDQNRRASGSSNIRTGFSLPSGLNKKQVRGIFWGFVLFFVLFLGGMVYFSDSRPRDLNTSINSFYTLNEVYKAKGIERFQEEKLNLKLTLAETIKNPENADVKRIAEAISVYLFPEILPDTHFEKEAAMTLWIPLFKQIEKKPGTAEARNLYEEAKAEIWNYENPDRKNAKLSETARETLKIYRELSAP